MHSRSATWRTGLICLCLVRLMLSIFCVTGRCVVISLRLLLFSCSDKQLALSRDPRCTLGRVLTVSPFGGCCCTPRECSQNLIYVQYHLECQILPQALAGHIYQSTNAHQ